MCLPVAAMGILSFAVSAASTVMGFMAQDQQAKAAQAAAVQANNISQHQTTLRQMQEDEANSQKMQQQNVEEGRIVSEVELSAAQGGVSGVSLDNLVGDVRRRAAQNRQTMFENTKMTLAQLDMEKKGHQSQAQSRINANPRPSPLSLVAGLAGNALSSYNSYSSRA